MSPSVRAGDLVLEFIPALSFNRQGGRLRVDGYVALDMLAYVDGTQVSSILPRANILANLEAIDNLFFVDASLFAGQSVENPFLPRSAFSSTNNLYTSTQARLAPYFKGNVGQYVTMAGPQRQHLHVDLAVGQPDSATPTTSATWRKSSARRRRSA